MEFVSLEPDTWNWEASPARFIKLLTGSRIDISLPDMMNSSSVTIHIPGPLRDCCAGASEFALSASNLHAVLEELERRHPALHRSICDETGKVRRHINLFVNTNNMRDRAGLDTPLAPGDEVTILPAVSGG